MDTESLIYLPKEKSSKCNEKIVSGLIIGIPPTVIIILLIVLFSTTKHTSIDFNIMAISNVTSTSAIVHMMALKNETYKLQLVYIRTGIINSTVLNYNPTMGQYFTTQLCHLLPDTDYLIYLVDITDGRPSTTSNDLIFRTYKNNTVF